MSTEKIQESLREVRDVQIVHNTMLEQLCDDTSEIRLCLLGEDNRSGLIMDVDRLKRSHRIFKTTAFIILTGTVTAICAFLLQ